MKILHTTELEKIEKVQKLGHCAVSIRTNKMIDEGVPMMEFPIFNTARHTFIETEERETISIKTPNGKMITLFITEQGDWANIDLKIHNEDIKTSMLAFADGSAKSITGNLYALDIKQK